MSIFTLIGNIFAPAAKLIDSIHTSEEEKLKLKKSMAKIQSDFESKVIDYEKSLMTLRSEAIVAETKGESWLQRNWRPITMLTFLVLVVCDSFGMLKFRLASEAWVLLQIGLGGYVIGRSGEKLLPAILKGVKK